MDGLGLSTAFTMWKTRERERERENAVLKDLQLTVVIHCIWTLKSSNQLELSSFFLKYQYE